MLLAIAVLHHAGVTWSADPDGKAGGVVKRVRYFLVHARARTAEDRKLQEFL
jgi:hypothetical protein